MAPRGRCVALGGRAGQLGMLPGADESGHRTQFRRWVIVAIALLVAVQSLLWASLDGMAHAAYLSTLAVALNPVFTYCMIENFGSAASRSVRIGLRVGCWVVYPVAFMFILIDSSGMGGSSTIDIAMHIMFNSIDGTSGRMESSAARLYIVTTASCSLGALVGALLGHLSARLAAGVRESRRQRPGGW